MSSKLNTNKQTFGPGAHVEARLPELNVQVVADRVVVEPGPKNPCPC
jgi:hypothetical protein